jgi:hypothetical protein
MRDIQMQRAFLVLTNSAHCEPGCRRSCESRCCCCCCPVLPCCMVHGIQHMFGQCLCSHHVLLVVHGCLWSPMTTTHVTAVILHSQSTPRSLSPRPATSRQPGCVNYWMKEQRCCGASSTTDEEQHGPSCHSEPTVEGAHRSSCMHGSTSVHPTLITPTDEQLEPLRSDRQSTPRSRR